MDHLKNLSFFDVVLGSKTLALEAPYTSDILIEQMFKALQDFCCAAALEHVHLKVQNSPSITLSNPLLGPQWKKLKYIFPRLRLVEACADTYGTDQLLLRNTTLY